MTTIAPEPISPELALVCPELAAAARAALPDIDLDRPARSPATDVIGPRTPVWAYALAYAAASFAQLALWSVLWIGLAAALATVPLMF